MFIPPMLLTIHPHLLAKIVALDEHEKADFEACNYRFKSSNVKQKVVYFDFDILYTAT
ncbi:hypothetical protein [Paenibacillus sp. V4I7]|uniref:hypothetical protein n=1 Tax=Paenibacillus sp. V4I7 TaxID=3042307 RepID=UPI0027822775|nr:hypothetical protein [Paenibacillus sp. V4I7]MDQ0899029.1 ATP-dependent DNA ligase [Paenibacillus sp. V4I7]